MLEKPALQCVPRYLWSVNQEPVNTSRSTVQISFLAEEFSFGFLENVKHLKMGIKIFSLFFFRLLSKPWWFSFKGFSYLKLPVSLFNLLKEDWFVFPQI